MFYRLSSPRGSLRNDRHLVRRHATPTPSVHHLSSQNAFKSSKLSPELTSSNHVHTGAGFIPHVLAS